MQSFHRVEVSCQLFRLSDNARASVIVLTNLKDSEEVLKGYFAIVSPRRLSFWVSFLMIHKKEGNHISQNFRYVSVDSVHSVYIILKSSYQAAL